MGSGSSKFDVGRSKSIHRGSMGGGGGGGGGVVLKCCQKYLRQSSFDSKVAGDKLASLQIY